MDYKIQNDVEMHAVAKRLAMEFSKSPHAGVGVDFISTCWYEVKGRPLFTAEPYISGEYLKYNNNDGWSEDMGRDESNAQVLTAQAFSHFTFQQTLGKLLIVDLQGVGSIFTDPQIHALDTTKYGQGNLGMVGIQKFLANHKCNRICNALRLTPYDKSTLPPVDETQRTPHPDQTMTCSCPLCGSIFTLLHSGFVAELAKYSEINCTPCSLEVKKSLTPVACTVCGTTKSYSLFWYKMKGMELPKLCRQCKAIKKSTKAPAAPKRPAWHKIPDGWAPATTIGQVLKRIAPTFAVKDHASGLKELMRLHPAIEIRDSGNPAVYFARLRTRS
ncbi:hypothetical protein SPRG_21492 [Saprolegnia parasitica CBS 223.65]|uniref:Alpha-type protein kinase domain-containing protein n=1 Tax=Saprolegnia parasitica (strain CBS 223.65) TaxID=695850 RepID=A0A067BMY0_SAPPC|nr:hypothetical protein SPRG_21492 [Saprolegnia parasitica CBS 223.65]KDO19583.1 hypothetical protein SPRG_21492 [Saprolegnia parasitica CBS 223.65]|eukprot:XP_012209708.1 hypothetical protein SPRG_21492 [Saprolegnia parasitica CBS 223.65]